MKATLSPDEYAPSHAAYIANVADSADILDTLRRQRATLAGLATAAADRAGHRYAPGKWSVREVVGHLADGERVFGYRAFCISRGEEQPLPGFDENVYVERAGADRRPLHDLVAELLALRDANLLMLGALADDAWTRSGTANETTVSVRALAYVMAGHTEHHLGILRDRYGVALPAAGATASAPVPARPV